VAQDFQSAFEIGADGRHISVVDGIGVSLAAIQGVHAELQDSRAQVQEQDREISRLKSELSNLREDFLQRLALLETRAGIEQTIADTHASRPEVTHVGSPL
jgi:hypothetical protein